MKMLQGRFILLMVISNTALCQPPHKVTLPSTVQIKEECVSKLKQAKQWIQNNKVVAGTTAAITAGAIITLAIIITVYRQRTKNYRIISSALNTLDDQVSADDLSDDFMRNKRITKDTCSAMLGDACDKGLPVSFLQTLLKCGAEVNYDDGDGLYTLDYALAKYIRLQTDHEGLDSYSQTAIQQQVNAIKFLLSKDGHCNNEHKANQERLARALAYPEMQTIFEEHYRPKVEKLLIAQISADKRDSLVIHVIPGSFNPTELLWGSCLSGKITVELAQLLLNAGAQVNLDSADRTPLDNIVRFYLSEKNRNSSSAEQLTAWYNVIEFLLSCRAEFKIVTNHQEALNDPQLKPLLLRTINEDEE